MENLMQFLHGDAPMIEKVREAMHLLNAKVVPIHEFGKHQVVRQWVMQYPNEIMWATLILHIGQQKRKENSHV